MLLNIDHDEFSSENARQDKIELEIGNWHLIGHEAEMTMFCHALHRECVAQEWHRLPRSRGGPPYLWFNALQGAFGGKRKLKFRAASTGSTQLNRPLISGALEIARVQPSQSVDGSRYVVRASLSLNPTRYVAYLRSHPNTSMNPAEWLWTSSDRNLLTGAMPLLGEFALDNRDNLLVGETALLAGSSPHWRAHVARYYYDVLGMLQRCFNTASISQRNQGGVSVFFQPNINLKSVETYWEFQCENALTWANRAHAALRPMGRDFSSRTFPMGMRTTDIDGNALSHSFNLTDEISCTVYAKTEERIRVEMRYKLKDAAVLNGRHTSDDLQDLMPWLDTIADDAGRRVQPVVQAIRRSVAPIRGQVTSLMLMIKVARAAADEATARSVAEVLFNLSMVDLRVFPQLAETVAILVANGVLERSRPRSRQYRVTSMYQVALEQLTAIMGGVGMIERSNGVWYRRRPQARSSDPPDN